MCMLLWFSQFIFKCFCNPYHSSVIIRRSSFHDQVINRILENIYLYARKCKTKGECKLSQIVNGKYCVAYPCVAYPCVAYPCVAYPCVTYPCVTYPRS